MSNEGSDLLSTKQIMFIMGATGTGKSQWALELAARMGGYVVNADSVQVYKGPRIGSNLPSEEDFKKAPHRLYSYVSAPEEMTAGKFRRDFLCEVESLPEAARVLVVGGTGFYFRALEYGLFEAPPVEESVSRVVRLVAENPGGNQSLWSELNEKDPESASAISVQDSYRLCRAVELLRSGFRPSDLKKKFQPQSLPWKLSKKCLMMNRDQLREVISQRTRRMLEAGLIEETKYLLSQYGEHWAPLQAVGYNQVVQALRGELSFELLEEEITLRTFQLTKRQNTWFKKELNTDFYEVPNDFHRFIEDSERFFI